MCQVVDGAPITREVVVYLVEWKQLAVQGRYELKTWAYLLPYYFRKKWKNMFHTNGPTVDQVCHESVSLHEKKEKKMRIIS